MYLVHAFNSVPMFAWAERTFFQTPYYHAAIEVEARVPAGVSVRDGKRQLSEPTAPACDRLPPCAELSAAAAQRGDDQRGDQRAEREVVTPKQPGQPREQIGQNKERDQWVAFHDRAHGVHSEILSC